MLPTLFTYAFALLLLAAGAYHFYNPAFYDPFMPDWFPKRLANALGGLAELIIGVLMLVPQTRTLGLYQAAGLMVVFLPLHVIDLARERPVIGSKSIAVGRLLLQFGLIYGLYVLALTSSPASPP